jgi:MFS superfamily sulfate permease-like transporter
VRVLGKARCTARDRTGTDARRGRNGRHEGIDGIEQERVQVRAKNARVCRHRARLVDSNNPYENTLASLGECFERNAEGMLKNMAIHELALPVSFYEVSATEFSVTSRFKSNNRRAYWIVLRVTLADGVVVGIVLAVVMVLTLSRRWKYSISSRNSQKKKNDMVRSRRNRS